MSFKTGRVKPYDASDYALQSVRDLVSDVKDKLYAQCGDIDPNPLKVDVCDVKDTYQVKDCAGQNVGVPEKVLKTVTLNKQIVDICNTTALAAAIAAVLPGGGTAYNTPDCIVIAPGSNQTIAANTVHSLSYKVMGGDGTLQIDNGANINLINGEADGWTASGLISKSLKFTAGTGTIKLIITKA